jgi:hypothetical protein
MKKVTRMTSFEMMKQRESAHAMQALRTVLSLMPDDITDVKLQILPGCGLSIEGEAYVLVCAGSNYSDQLTIQILSAEYSAINQHFPPTHSGISRSIPLATLAEALMKMMVGELLANLN